MNLINQSWNFENIQNSHTMLAKLELAGRTCYKSEDRITLSSAEEFCKKIIRSGHHSVLEHASISVRIITNRGVSHEIVRHRLASYSQESTRYCNYGGKEIEFIKPVWGYVNIEAATAFYEFLLESEKTYKRLLDLGWRPEQAREVLPNALKTELIMTANVREWRHFFTLRCSPKAHPQMRDLALSMLRGFTVFVPTLFLDIYDKFHERCPNE